MASDKNKADLSPIHEKMPWKKTKVNDKREESGVERAGLLLTRSWQPPEPKHQPQAKAPHRSWSLFEMRKNSIAAYWQPNKLWIERQQLSSPAAGADPGLELMLLLLVLLLHATSTWVKCASVVVLSEIAAKRKTAKTNLLESCADKRSPQCHAKLQCYTGRSTNSGTTKRQYSTKLWGEG